jgi:2-amino-4-hydroxy-6-hydroxymethyldihydropteridine diphosphokinase
MAQCLIGLGSNLGDRRRALDEALAELVRRPEIRLVAQSAWIETRPAGGPPDQSPYLNGAALLETALGPEPLLGVLQEIECAGGRQRDRRWDPRTIDLDLLLYDEVVLSLPGLEIPHPRMAGRRFVLEPAARIAGEMLHPRIGWTIWQLLAHLDSSPCYLAIDEAVGSGAITVARQVAQRTGSRLLSAALPAKPALEWLEGLTRQLQADRPEWHEPAAATVSDFWLDASAVVARQCVSAPRWDVFRTRWEEVRLGLVRPRLIVLLETPVEEGMRRLRELPGGSDWVAERIEWMSAAIVEAALEPGQGPVLRLPGTNLDAAADEVTAALEAMR